MSVLSLKDAHGTIVDLVDALKSGRETEILVVEEGRTVARLVPEASSPEMSPYRGERRVAVEGLHGEATDVARSEESAGFAVPEGGIPPARDPDAFGRRIGLFEGRYDIPDDIDGDDDLIAGLFHGGAP